MNGADGDGSGAVALKATRLWRSDDLDAADREALLRACSDVRPVNAGTALVRQGAPCGTLYLLLDGWAARVRYMEDGSRFIPALATPGDICNLDALRFDQLDYAVTMLTAGKVAALPRQRVLDLHASNPRIAAAFWSLALAENTILTEWAASIGRRSAQDRLAHLLCELLVRLAAVSKADGLSFDLPLTQEQIADTLGLTAVHVNRTLQALRSKELVTFQSRRVTIHDWPALSAMCGFRPNYLHLDDTERTLDSILPSIGARTPSRPLLRPSFGPGSIAP